MGSVFRAVESGYQRIAIVDGLFGNVPSVWHKEILFAISRGAEVIGAASMGALRAAELFRFGMVGIGRIYRLYRRGLWTDDDEVAVTHASAEFDYRALSEPMANIRFTLRNLRRSRIVDPRVSSALENRQKQRHFSDRTRETLQHDATDLLGSPEAMALIAAFAARYVDAKKVDALALLECLERAPSPQQQTLDWTFPATVHWIKQFRHDVEDIPRLF